MGQEKTFVDQFAELLVKKNIISEKECRTYKEQFEHSAAEAFEYFLYEEGLVSKEDLLDTLSRYYSVPAIDVTGYFFDHELLSNFTKGFLLRNRIIPLELDGEMLIMVAANPADQTLLEKMGGFVSNDIRFQVGFAPDIIDAIEEYYDQSITEVDDDMELEREREEQEEFEQETELE